MTTEEYVRQYMPGERERREDSARYDEIVACVEDGRPLPDGFDSTIETATASYIKSRARERRSGTLPEAGYRRCLEDMRKSFVREYRALATMRCRYKEILANGLTFSRQCTDLLQSIDRMSDEEIIDKLLALFGIVFNEVEERLLRKKWHEGKEKRAEETKKAKKSKKTQKERHRYGEYKNVLLTDDDFEKLKAEFLDDYEQRIESLSEYMESSGKSYKNHLATMRAWSRKDKPQKADKASYDIKKFESVENLAALKFIEKEG